MARNRTFSLNIGWRTLLKDAGLTPEDILRRAGLPDDTFSRTERGLDTDEYIRLWHALEAGMNHPAFPLPLSTKFLRKCLIRRFRCAVQHEYDAGGPATGPI
jgi:transcriptional regulator with XRE-family HTH domain